jgi:hypothetical protein
MRTLIRTLSAITFVFAVAACADAPSSISAPEDTTVATSGGTCYDPTGCTALGGAYISHYTGWNCTGIESYYTPYFYYDGIRRSWDGNGIAGNTLYTITNISYRDQWGICRNAWPGGNTLSDFVLIYR